MLVYSRTARIAWQKLKGPSAN